MQEIWKPAVDFECTYEVSNTGKVRNINLLWEVKAHVNSSGYLYVNLSIQTERKRKSVHQLVAAAFIDGFNYGDIVNHIDGNKQNNHANNLEKSTVQDNTIHAYTNNLKSKPGKSKYYYVCVIRSNTKSGVSIRYAALIKDLGKVVFKKSFKSEEEAAKAADAYLDSINDTRRLRNFPK